MRSIRFYYIGVLIFILNASSFSQSLDSLKNTGNNFNYLEKQIQEIRRDQLNYKIEKDILKEVYSSNIATINLVITLILAVFGIIGF